MHKVHFLVIIIIIYNYIFRRSVVVPFINSKL